MDFKDIQELIEKIDKSSISLLELKIDDLYIKMDKSLNRTDSVKKEEVNNTVNKAMPIQSEVVEAKVAENIMSSTEVKNEMSISNDENLDIITSPMVGTFYEAPGVGQNAFVSVGQKIKQGDTLCIVEAMKLMNEIEAEFDGEIVEILVSNGQMVEFGTELFKVRR